MYSVKTFVAKTLSIKQIPAIIVPAIVTARHPYLLTKALENGPAKEQQE